MLVSIFNKVSLRDGDGEGGSKGRGYMYTYG